MKILQKHDFITIVYLLPCLGAFLILFLPYSVAFCFRAQALFLILALLLIVTPWANQRMPLESPNLQRQAKRLPFIKCLGLTFLLQTALILAFYTICHLTAATLPINIAPFPLFQTTVSILLLDWGLFPWGLYVLMAVGLGYVGYIRKQPGDMSTLLRPLTKNMIGDAVSLVADVTTKIAIILSLISTLALISMECIGLIGAYFNLPLAYGLRLDVFLAMVVLLKMTKSDFCEQQLSRLLKLSSPILVVTSFLLLMIIGFLLLSFLIGWLSPIFTAPLNRELNFTPDDWPVIWAVFSGMWWLSWTPLVAGMLTYVWRGYKIRTLIVGTLLLAITAGILESAYPNWSLNISLNTSWLNLVPALLAGGIIMGLFLRAQVITYASKATLPTIWHDYRRSPKTFLKRLLQLMIIFMGLYWAGGIYISGMIYFIIGFPTALFVFTVGVGVFKMLAGKAYS